MYREQFHLEFKSLHCEFNIKHEESKQCAQMGVIVSVGNFLLIQTMRLSSPGTSGEAA